MDFTPEKMLERIITTECGGELKTVYPHFIASKYDLIISALKVGGRYYVHENGCVVNYLREAGIYGLFDKNRKMLECVFGFAFSENKLQRSYTREECGWFDFIKSIIFLLNLDIILPYLDTEERYNTNGYFLTNKNAVREDICDLKDRISLKSFEKDDGFMVGSGITYSNSDVGGSSVFVQEMDEGAVYLDDGETHFRFRRDVLEYISQTDDGYEVYGDIINKVCERYGVEFQNEKIFMTSKPNTEVLLNNYFRFLQASVLLSEVGEAGMLCKHKN